MGNLPIGWTEVAFKDVLEVNPRKSVGLEPDDDVTFVPMAAVNEFTGTIMEQIVRPLREVEKGFKQFSEGDVIFAKITPSMENGKSAVAVALENGIGFGSTEFHVFRSYGAVLPEYIWRFVRQKSFREGAQKVMSGAVGQQRVPADYLKSCRLPLPPISEQKRIVEKLDKLTARILRARADLDRVPALVEKYKVQLLSQAFTGELTKEWRKNNPHLDMVLGREEEEIRSKFIAGVKKEFIPPYSIPQNWEWLALPEIGDLDRGKSKHRPRNDPRLFGGDYPFVQTGDVRAANRFLTSYSETYNELGLSQSRLWPKGTVCITIAANIAETAILGMEACFPDSVVGFLADKNRVSSDYVEFFIRTMREELDAFAPATAQKNINLNVLSSIRVPVPPIEEQEEIIRRIEAEFSMLDRISADHARAVELLPKLETEISSRAFQGKLVSQDPRDEPSSTLLKRIRNGHKMDNKKTQNSVSKNKKRTKKPKDLLLSDSENWPDQGLPFEDIAKQNPIAHDDMRDAIFSLLSEKKPRIRQYFNKEAACIYLQRIKQ